VSASLWWAIVILVVIAFAIIFPPLWRKRSSSQDSESELARQNIIIARQKMAELKQQLEADVIDQQQFDAQLLELEAALKDDLELSRKNTGTEKQGRWIIAVIAIVLPVVLVSLYRVLGNPDALQQAAQQTTEGTKKQIGSVADMANRLVEHLKNKPDDIQGWIMLGKSYKYMKQYAKAVQAFEKANVLSTDQPEVMLLYADTLVMLDNGHFSEKARTLIFKALEFTPNDVTGLWLAGLAMAEQGNFAEAMQYFKKVEAQVPEGSDSKKEIQALIARLELHNHTLSKQTKDSVAKATIQVRVSLAPALQNQAAANDTVFIYARALSGSQMPLAIVRKQVKDLPLLVTLNDAQAMMPMMKLSKFRQVSLIARISRSGNAMTQPGDLVGNVDKVDVGGQKIIEINIDKII